MARILTITALLAAGFSLGACSLNHKPLTPDWNPSISSVNQPVVQRTDYVFDVASSGGVPEGELARLDAWFASLGLTYGDRVAIDAGYDDPAARADVARVAGSYGLLLSDGAPMTAGAIQPGTVRVVVSRSQASVPGCPRWPAEFGARLSTSPNYGCATNSNIAAMIADPNDLVLGQAGAAGTNGDTSTKAIKSFRERPPTGSGSLKAESTGGK